jgi:hypothetical protein
MNLFCKGATLGAGLMYFFDPQRGRRRRALVRDAAIRFSNELRDAADVTRRDLSNRFQGFKSEAQSLFSSQGESPSDEQIKARVRSQLGRASSHPRAIEVEVRDGQVTLRGPVLTQEAQRVFDAVCSIRGVKHVDNQMETHQEPGNIAALQGGATRDGAQWDIFQQRWSPATRALVGGGALALLTRAAPRSGVRGAILGAITTALAAQSWGRSRPPWRARRLRHQSAPHAPATVANRNAAASAAVNFLAEPANRGKTPVTGKEREILCAFPIS